MMKKNNQNDTKSGLNIKFSLLLRIYFFMSVHKLKTSIDFGQNVIYDQFSRQKIINIETDVFYRCCMFNCVTITCNFEVFNVFSFLLDPNNIHSVLPRCNDSLLSTSQSEQDSRTFPSLCAI